MKHYGRCRTIPAGTVAPGITEPWKMPFRKPASSGEKAPSWMAVTRKIVDGCVLAAAAICARDFFPSAVTVTGPWTGTGAGMCEMSQASRTVAVPLNASASTPPAVPHCHSSHDFHGAIRLAGGAAGEGQANQSGHPVQDVRCWPTLWLV